MDDYKLIPLTQGQFAKVDPSDFEWLSHWSWRVQKTGRTIYARTKFTIGSKRITVFMHRLICGGSYLYQVDHINGDGADNRKSNLRLVKPEQNRMNTAGRGVSKYKNVAWHKPSGKWQVKIKHNGKQYYGGMFKDEIEAARVADIKMLELHGEYARLNFPEEHRKSKRGVGGGKRRKF